MNQQQRIQPIPTPHPERHRLAKPRVKKRPVFEVHGWFMPLHNGVHARPIVWLLGCSIIVLAAIVLE